MDDAHWYNLQGIYLGTAKPSVPGVYIRRTTHDHWQGNNGKIIVIK